MKNVRLFVFSVCLLSGCVNYRYASKFMKVCPGNDGAQALADLGWRARMMNPRDDNCSNVLFERVERP